MFSYTEFLIKKIAESKLMTIFQRVTALSKIEAI